MSPAVDQYGVFGHPVGHSFSPFIHGVFARDTGQQMSYRAYDVEPQELGSRVQEFFGGGGRGLNITLPHKVAAVEVVQELTARAAHAAAVNTLVLQDDNIILGDNTDGAGLVRDLCDNLGLVVTQRRLLILGAGGATRGVLAPLLGLQPAIAVIADLGVTQGVGFAYVGDTPFDLIINATSASLSGDIPPIPAGAVGPETVCYDLAYGRSAMAFVRWAQQSGCALAVQGLGMLVEQAAESFRLWRGVRPATVEVLAALKQRIGSV